MQVRRVANEAREDVRQQPAGDGGHRGDAQMPGLVLGDQAHVAHHPVVVLDQFLGIAHELHPERGQVRPGRAGVALLEQRLAELAFQVANGKGNRRLGAVGLFRCRMETLQFGDPDEVPELHDLEVRQHGKFSLSTNIYY
ncbi:hypothetical protein D3C78_1296290 [compost metagenome]